MAAIEQIIQIAANERSASSAQSTADTAAQSAATANTAAGMAQTTANTAVTNAAAAQTTANNAIPHTAITNAAGSGLTITNPGMPNATYSFAAPTQINLSDVHTYTTAAVRNAVSDVAWHIGDIAILTQSSSGTRMESVDSPYSVTGFVGPGVRIFNAWDVDNDMLRDNLGFTNGDTIRFRNTSDDIVGTTTPGNNGNFVVSNIRRISGTAHVLFDITPALGPFNPALDVGSAIVTTQSVTFNIVSGTYIYTGASAGDNYTGVTTDADWTLLNVPGGTAANSDLATFTLNTADPARLGQVTYNSTTDVLTINGTAIELATTAPALPTLTRNFFQYTGTTLNITGIGPSGTDGPQTINVATNSTNWTNRLGGAAVGTSWPTATASLYIDSNKGTYGTPANAGDWVFTGNGTGITITISQEQRRLHPVGALIPISLEMETLVLSQ